MEAIEQENEEFTATPPEIGEQAIRATVNLLPEKSRIQYEGAYNLFSKWCSEKQIKIYSENVLLAYFQQLSASMKPPSLWTIYLMLRSTLNLKNNVDITKYPKLCSFLKRTSDGYKPKKVQDSNIAANTKIYSYSTR
ncbi:serine-threonine protein kinase [Holotrichia oblita]|uniref:Serine-threonine protein kinase n=1 Tax=Holotrichia oblita TaxID=644536 RepID=A0ACB9TV22_HOLOL|nr:serine-threonine protein kinase [Holotrichia oblita]